jgi:hypothetical protein
MKRKNLVRIILPAAIILLIPLAATIFTDEVDWDVRDFAVIGALLISAGLMYELLSTRVSSKYRLFVAAAFIGLVLLVWAELAVGIIGTPFAGS